MILIRLVKTYDSFESCMSDQPCNLIVEAECVYSNDRGTFQRTSMELRCDVPLAFPVSDFVCSGVLPNDQGEFADRAEDGTIVVEFSDGYVGYEAEEIDERADKLLTILSEDLHEWHRADRELDALYSN